MSFGDILKKLRNEYNLTQEELANKLSISKGTIGMYEINKRFPDKDPLNAIADFFKVSTDFLLGRTNIRNNAERISEAIKDDKELLEFWNTLKDRPDLQLMFKQTKELNEKDIKQILKIIKTFEEEEASLD